MDGVCEAVCRHVCHTACSRTHVLLSQRARRTNHGSVSSSSWADGRATWGTRKAALPYFEMHGEMLLLVAAERDVLFA